MIANWFVLQFNRENFATVFISIFSNACDAECTFDKEKKILPAKN